MPIENSSDKRKKSIFYTIIRNYDRNPISPILKILFLFFSRLSQSERFNEKSRYCEHFESFVIPCQVGNVCYLCDMIIAEVNESSFTLLLFGLASLDNEIARRASMLIYYWMNILYELILPLLLLCCAWILRIRLYTIVKNTKIFVRRAMV